MLPSCTTRACLSRSGEEAGVDHPAFKCIYQSTVDQIFMVKLSKFSKIITTKSIFSVQNRQIAPVFSPAKLSCS